MYWFKDGSRYEGNWSEHHRSGMGSLYLSGVSEYEGSWNEGAYIAGTTWRRQHHNAPREWVGELKPGGAWAGEGPMIPSAFQTNGGGSRKAIGGPAGAALTAGGGRGSPRVEGGGGSGGGGSSVRYARIDAGDASPEELIRSIREGGGLDLSVDPRGSGSRRRGQSSIGRGHRGGSVREQSIGDFVAEEDPYMVRTSSGRRSSGGSAHRSSHRRSSSHRSSSHRSSRRSSRGLEPEEEGGPDAAVPQQQRGLASG